MFRKSVATAATAVAMVGLSAVPADALIGGHASSPSAQTDSVVKLVMPAGRGLAHECTGTAISSQWVITAAHCISESQEKAGTVVVGQGDQRSEYSVNDWKIASKGDVALVHVTEPIQLGSFPAWDKTGVISDSLVKGQVYGWSSLGDGRTGQLPTTEVEAKRCLPANVRCDRDESFFVNTGRALLQQGDSGGPLFVNGQLVGMLSAGVTWTGFLPIEVSPYNQYTSTAALADWIDQTIGTNPQQAPANDGPGMNAPAVPQPLPTETISPEEAGQFFPESANPGLSPSVR